MTDPVVWYIYIYVLTKLGYIDGKCYHFCGIHTDPVGYKMTDKGQIPQFHGEISLPISPTWAGLGFREAKRHLGCNTASC